MKKKISIIFGGCLLAFILWITTLNLKADCTRQNGCTDDGHCDIETQNGNPIYTCVDSHWWLSKDCNIGASTGGKCTGQNQE